MVGNDDGAPMNGVSGSGLPARIWRDFMLSAFCAQARMLRLADGPDEVHRGVIARIELMKRGHGR